MYHVVVPKVISKGNPFANGQKSFRSSLIFATRSYTTELRQTLDEVAKDFKVTQMADWYKLAGKVLFRITVTPTKLGL